MKKRLYLGLECNSDTNEWIHFPVIKIVPRTFDNAIIKNFHQYTHFLFTSKSAVKILSHSISIPQNRIVISVGSKTSEILIKNNIHPHYTAKNETAEGVIEILETITLDHANLLWPHSSLSRPILLDYFIKRNIRYTDCILYDTVLNIPGPIPDLDNIQEIVFTSPSTIDNFLYLCPNIPSHIKLTVIGPVTEKHLLSKGFHTEL